MTELYPWFVFAHVVGVVLFAAAHGVAMWTAFRIRGERDRVVVSSHLRNSLVATRIMYLGLLLLIVGGLAAAAAADLWARPWIWGSMVVLVVVLVAMWALATPYYMGLRKAADGDPGKRLPPVSDDDLAALLVSRRPDVLAAVGIVGFLVLIWLMVLKPG